jgi:hypothetical protein
MKYSVWWTGDVDGVQKNWKSEQFRFIRVIPVPDVGPADNEQPEPQWRDTRWDDDHWQDDDWESYDTATWNQGVWAQNAD